MAQMNINPTNANPGSANEASVMGAEAVATAVKKTRGEATRGSENAVHKPNTKKLAATESAGSNLGSSHGTPPTPRADTNKASGDRAASGGTGSEIGTGKEAGVEKSITIGAREKSAATETKASSVLKKLRTTKGVTVEAIMNATGWQAHSVRGFLSAVVKKKLGLNLVNETGKDGTRRYRIVSAGEGA